MDDPSGFLLSIGAIILLFIILWNIAKIGHLLFGCILVITAIAAIVLFGMFQILFSVCILLTKGASRILEFLRKVIYQRSANDLCH